MNGRSLSTRSGAMVVALVAGAASASAAVVFDTGMPGGGFGFIGYDVSVGQSVAIAFTPAQSYTLDEIGAWIMSNDDAPGRMYTLSLRADASGSSLSEPAATAIESWNVSTEAIGWSPILEMVTSTLHPTLNAGLTYWIVAESSEPVGFSPVWVWGDSDASNYMGIIDFQSGSQWSVGATEGSSPGVIVHGTLVPGPGAAWLFAAAGIGTTTRRRRS